jgi:hypothetical protein
MGLLDGLLGTSGGGLLDFLRNNAINQQMLPGGLASDQAQYGQPVQQAQAPMRAMAQMPQQAQPSPLDTAQWPSGPVGAPSQGSAALPPNAQPTQGQLPVQAQPQQVPPQQAPAFGDVGNILGRIGNPDGLLARLTGNDSRSVGERQANQTAHFLVSKGLDPAMAKAIASDSSLLRSVLPQVLGNGERVRPATAEERKAYGAPDNVPMSIDTATGKPSYGPAATNVTTTINGEKEQDKVIGKGYGERFNDIQKAGIAAPGTLGTLNLMDKLISDPNFYSGAGGEAATSLKRLAVSAGIAGADTAAPNELFQKMAQKSVLDAAGGSLGTGFSNADREYLNGTVPNIGNTPEGNKLIIEVGRQVQKRNLEIARQAREYAKAHGGRLDAGFEDQIAAYAEKNPLFVNMPQTPKAAASSTFREGATATNPQTGQTITFRNGKWQ